MGKNIAVTSGKGGTGKTVTAAAVASCLAALGHRTLCLDCDVGLKNLDLALGLTELAVMDFSDVLSGAAELSDAVTAHPAIDGLFFLSAPTGVRPDDIDTEAMRRLGDRIRETYDFCLIDGPAGIDAGFRLAAAAADSAIVVSSGDAASLRDGQRTVIEHTKLGIDDIRLIVNRVRPFFFRRTSSTVDDVIDTVGARLLGLIPEDRSVMLAASLEKPLILYKNGGPAARQFLAAARRIAGEDVPLSLR